MRLKRILEAFFVRAAQALGLDAALPLLGKLRRKCSNWEVWEWESFLMAMKARGSTLGFPLLILFALLLGAASSARADQFNCSDAPYNGVIDGNLYPFPDNIKLDTKCTI